MLVGRVAEYFPLLRGLLLSIVIIVMETNARLGVVTDPSLSLTPGGAGDNMRPDMGNHNSRGTIKTTVIN